MKKYLPFVVGTCLAISLSAFLLTSQAESSVNGSVGKQVNRTVSKLVERSKKDETLLELLESYPKEAPIIEYKGGFFVNKNESKETYVLEIKSEDNGKVLFKDDDPATIGEVVEAIKSAEK